MIQTLKQMGIFAILATVTGTLIASGTMWMFESVSEVKPLTSAVKELTVEVKGFSQELNKQIIVHEVTEWRLNALEEKCSLNSKILKECKEHTDGTRN